MATINYNSGNINVSFFPTNVNPIWFCDKNTGGINIATNGATIAVNTLQLGNSGTTTQINGALSTAYLNSVTPGTNMTIAGNQLNNGLDLGCMALRTGWVNMGRFMAGGSINIGDGHTAITNINIGTAVQSLVTVRGSTVNIADNGGTVNVGNSGSTTTVSGTFRANLINSTAASQRIDIGNNQDSGILTIGDSSTRTGTIYIGNNIAGDIAVGYSQKSGNNYLGSSTTTNTYVRGSNLYIGDNNTTGSISIGNTKTSGTIYIGGGQTGTTTMVSGTNGFTENYIRGSNVYICDAVDGGSVSIGNSKNTGTIYVGANQTGSTTMVLGTSGTSRTNTYLRGSVINIGDDNTAGDINIGLASGRTGYINIGNNMSGGAIQIGSNAGGAFPINIGTSNSTINMAASNIKQTVPLLGGGTVETVIGNATNITSMSTTFNRKNRAGGSFAIPCYRVVAPSQYNTQYCELIVSGANYGLGGYTAKYCFTIERPGITIAGSNLNTLYGYNPAGGGNPVITFTIIDSWTMDININAGMTSSGGLLTTYQTFISTLIAYPSISIDNTLTDFTVTAI